MSDLSDELAYAFSQGADMLNNTVHALYDSRLNEPISIGAITILGLPLILAGYNSLRAKKEARDARAKNVFSGKQAVVSTTHYVPEYVIDPETREEKRVFVQKIITLDKGFDTGELFDKATRDQDIEPLRTAALACYRKGNTPTVFQTLYDEAFAGDGRLGIFAPPKIDIVARYATLGREACAVEKMTREALDEYRAILRVNLKSHFSDALYDNRARLRAPQQEAFNRKVVQTAATDEASVDLSELEDEYYVDFAAEDLERGRKLRVIIVPKIFLDDPSTFPAFEDVVFRNEDGSLSNDPHHPQAARWQTTKTFLDQLKINRDLREDTYFSLSSGVYVDPRKMPSSESVETAVVSL